MTDLSETTIAVLSLPPEDIPVDVRPLSICAFGHHIVRPRCWSFYVLASSNKVPSIDHRMNTVPSPAFHVVVLLVAC